MPFGYSDANNNMQNESSSMSKESNNSISVESRKSIQASDDDCDKENETLHQINIPNEQLESKTEDLVIDNIKEDNSESNQSEDETVTTIQLYKRRWIMLLLFSLNSLMNALLWITFAPIANVAVEYYNVNEFAINFLSMLFMLIFIPGVPVQPFVIEKFGLRTGVICGAVLTVIGAATRFLPWPFANPADTPILSYVMVVIGTTIEGIAQIFVLATPPMIAQQWFGDGERVTATAIGAIFNQLGIAIGFFLSPAVVRGDADNIPMLLAIQTVMCLPPTILLILFFKSNPPTPASLSSIKSPGSINTSTEDEVDLELKDGQTSQSTSTNVEEQTNFKEVIYELCRMPSFILLVNCYGITIGSFYAVSTLINQILSPPFSEAEVGYFGVIMVVVGLFGGILFGYIADKTKAYKALIIINLVGTAGSMIWFSLIKSHNIALMSVCCSLLGFFTTAMIPISLDVCVEITYPLPESVTSSMLVVFSQIYGILFIIIMTVLLSVSIDYALWCLIGMIGIGVVEGFLFNPNLKRMAVEQQATEEANAINTNNSSDEGSTTCNDKSEVVMEGSEEVAVNDINQIKEDAEKNDASASTEKSAITSNLTSLQTTNYEAVGTSPPL